MDRREAIKQTALMLGYAVSIPTLTGILNSCNNESKDRATVFLSSRQALLIGELSETILPKTETPGAKELYLDRFIDRFVSQVFSDDDKQDFLEGLDEFESKCRDMNGKGFSDCSAGERRKLLEQMESESAKMPGSIWGFPTTREPAKIPFYRKVKQMTLLGYFTSEEIGKNILTYNPVPGKFDADIPVSEAGNIAFE